MSDSGQECLGHASETGLRDRFSGLRDKFSGLRTRLQASETGLRDGPQRHKTRFSIKHAKNTLFYKAQLKAPGSTILSRKVKRRTEQCLFERRKHTFLLSFQEKTFDFPTFWLPHEKCFLFS